MIVVEGEFSPLDQIGYSLHLLHVFIRHFGPPYKKNDNSAYSQEQ